MRLMSALALLLLASGTAAAQEAVSLELNKLEQVDGDCRAFMVITNPFDHEFTEFKLDLVTFDRDGVVDDRLVLETAPLLADKTNLKVFDLADVRCDAIQKILVNDVTACTPELEGGCVQALAVSSRAEVDLSR